MSAEKKADDFLKTPLNTNNQHEPWREIVRFNPQKMWRIAELMVQKSLQITEGDRLLLQYNSGSSQLASMVGYQAAEQGAAVVARCEDPTVEAAILAGIGRHRTPAVFEEIVLPQAADIAWATKAAIVKCMDTPEAMDIVDGQIAAQWSQAREPLFQTRIERRRWALVYLPTKAEARLDQMNYEDYVDMFFRACDRPWEEIKDAQQVLIDEILNPGKLLQVVAGENLNERWRTNLTMSIDGQTFANSTIGRNIPGSEVFSSPVRGTIRGRLALPYPVMFGDKVLPNLILTFEDGRAVHYETDDESGMEWVEQQLNIDEGAREVGEIALGTNRAFNRPLLNGLYVEKVGGSGHLALGNAYQFRIYEGRPVVLDNGVRSADHIDLTYMMLPQYGGGRVMVDGKMVQYNGDFLDPRLEILNSST